MTRLYYLQLEDQNKNSIDRGNVTFLSENNMRRIQKSFWISHITIIIKKTA